MPQDLKILTDDIDELAKAQLDELARHPAFADSKIRVMPDVHAGAGCVIGFTAPVSKMVVPNIAGVDLGCGVRVCELGKFDVDLADLDAFVKENVPAGTSVHEGETCSEDWLREYLRCFPHLTNVPRLARSLGTLGGGNHFIELDEDEDGNKYLIVHTGSRNLGKQVAERYQALATLRCRQDDAPDAARALPDALCYLQGADRDDYLHDMGFCQVFAERNRLAICTRIGEYLSLKYPGCGYSRSRSFESVHNYISDDGMIRKGAIAAHAGQRVVIPLNMRDGAIIGVGKGNPDWNESAPHGAGRVMSRGAARRDLRLEDFRAAMDGIYTSTANEATIDEAPMAYKDASKIVSAIGDAVWIERIVKPIYNFKSPEGPAFRGKGASL